MMKILTANKTRILKQKSEPPKVTYRQKTYARNSIIERSFVTNKYDDPYLNSSIRFGNITLTSSQ
nr:CIH_HP1_G0025300.mRNA.1.CDS.1 [Saccharomyces cerevisiae]